MGLRHGLLASFSLVALAASAGAETMPRPSAPPPAHVMKLAQATVKAEPKAKNTSVATAKSAAQSNLPHTLAEALAAT
jgi:outer membrane protein